MKIWPGLLALLMVLVVACGTDDPRPASESNRTASSTATDTFQPSPTATTRPASTPAPPATATPTTAPTPTLPAGPNCSAPALQTVEDITSWPEPLDGYFDIERFPPWPVPEIPQGIPVNPEYQLSGGSRVPTDFAGEGPVEFRIHALNGYRETLEFGLANDPGYDFAVISYSGEIVWRFSDHTTVTPGPTSLTLNPGESRDFTAEWDLTGPDGARVEDGMYWVVSVVFREEPYWGLVNVDPMYIGERPSLDEALRVRLSAPSRVTCGGAVPMTIEITNVTDDVVMIYTGVDFDNYYAFVSTGETGRTEVWNWWANKWMTLGLFVRQMPPGATVEMRRNWTLQDLAENPVVPGTYELQARIRAAQVDDLPEKTEFAWSNVVEVTVSR